MKKNERDMKLSKRLNVKLSQLQGARWTMNTPLYVKNLLAEINAEIGGKGIESVVDPLYGVFIRYVNMGSPQTETILYDGKCNTFIVGTADELEKSQRERNEAWRNR